MLPLWLAAISGAATLISTGSTTREDPHRYQPRWTWKRKPMLGGAGPSAIVSHLPIDDGGQCEEANAPLVVQGNNANMSLIFQRAFRDYFTLLQGRSVGTERDAILHRYIKRTEDIEERFLIFRVGNPTIGLGNRLLGLISSFLLAMLTRRTFLVDLDDYRVDDLFCPPLGNHSWTFTGSWTKIASTLQTGALPAEEVDHLSGMYGKLAVLKLTERPEDEPATWSLLLDGDLGRRWNNVQIIQVQSNQYFVPLLFGNQHYRSILQSWFPTGEVATILARHLLRPRPFIWQSVRRHLEGVRLGEDSLGLQIRSFAGGPDPEDLQGAIECLDQLRLSQQPQVLLASLYPKASEHIRHNRPQWQVIHPHADKAQRPGLAQAIHALEDIVMLSQSARHLIVSPRSTLGYVAGALRGRPSWYLSRTDRVCNRAVSGEPCFHGVISKGPGWRDYFRRQRLNQTLSDGTLQESPLFAPCEDTDGYRLAHPQWL